MDSLTKCKQRRRAALKHILLQEADSYSVEKHFLRAASKSDSKIETYRPQIMSMMAPARPAVTAGKIVP